MLRKLATVLVVATLLTTAVAPVSAQSILEDDDLTPDVVEYGVDGDPSFILELENESTSVDSLQDWANASDTRELLAVDNDSKTATISAPAVEVRGRSVQLDGMSPDWFFGDQLEERGYIEAIHLNYRHANLDPVTLENESEFEVPKIGATSLNDPDYPTEGVAFDNVSKTTMAESRSILGADEVTQTGDGVTVAVLDSGVNTANGLVFGNGTAGSTIRIDNASKSMITGESVNATAGDFAAVEDGNGHGTWVSSAIAANSSNDVHDGLAPDANLLVLKTMNDEGKGSTSDIAEGIRYAADNDADVISMSLGSPVYDEAIADAIRYAYDNGVSAVVVAAGNSRPQRGAGVGSPGDVPGVVTVGATNGSANDTAASAYFSQVSGSQATDGNLSVEGERVDVVAPGMRTTARVPTRSGGVVNETLSGTSMATPMVAGGIATALEAHPTWTDHETLTERVRNSSRAVPHAASAEVGHGMFAADNLVDGHAPELQQEDAMTDAAEQRDDFYATFATANGGALARLGDFLGVGS